MAEHRIVLPPSVRAFIYFVLFALLVGSGMMIERFLWKGKEAKNTVEIMKDDELIVQDIIVGRDAALEEQAKRIKELENELKTDDCAFKPVPRWLLEPKSRSEKRELDKSRRVGKPTK